MVVCPTFPIDNNRVLVYFFLLFISSLDTDSVDLKDAQPFLLT